VGACGSSFACSGALGEWQHEHHREPRTSDAIPSQDGGCEHYHKRFVHFGIVGRFHRP
jgi:hypothetical protein